MAATQAQQITSLLDAGYGLDEIEHELIDADLSLDEDERAALWLFAWSYDAGRQQRYQAISSRRSGHLALGA